jgi:hypothetical protein
MSAMGSGATGIAFLLPLILGITAVTFVMTAIISLAPTEAEIREDAALTERLARMSGELDRRGADPAGRPRAWLPATGRRPVGLGFISAP